MTELPQKIAEEALDIWQILLSSVAPFVGAILVALLVHYLVFLVADKMASRTKGIADKCDFCTSRIRAGREPACVETCPSRSRVFGDLNDPKSEVSRLLASHRTSQRKVEAGTRPQIYYIDE